MHRDATVVTCDNVFITHTGKGIKWLSSFSYSPSPAPKPLPGMDAMMSRASLARAMRALVTYVPVLQTDTAEWNFNGLSLWHLLHDTELTHTATGIIRII